MVGYWVGLTLYFDIPLSAQSCLGRWKFGRIGWYVRQYSGTPKSKSTQPSNQPPSPPSNFSLSTHHVALVGLLPGVRPPMRGQHVLVAHLLAANITDDGDHADRSVRVVLLGLAAVLQVLTLLPLLHAGSIDKWSGN